jgi:hypothetical protein
MMAARASEESVPPSDPPPGVPVQGHSSNLRTPNFEYDGSPHGERFLIIETLVAPEYHALALVTN